MRLKQVNCKVPFIMRAGSDFVKNEMLVEDAKKFVKNGKLSNSDIFEGYPICVNDTYFFAATKPKKNAEPKE